MIRFLLLARFSLALLPSLHAAPAAVSFTQSATTVDAFDFVEISLNVTQPDAANPFTDVTVAGEFAREGGAPLTADYIVDRASELGLYIGMLPSWGRPPVLDNNRVCRIVDPREESQRLKWRRPRDRM